MDPLTNAESIQRIQELMSLYSQARGLSVRTFGPEYDLSALEAEMNKLKELLEAARIDPEFRLDVRR